MQKEKTFSFPLNFPLHFIKPIVKYQKSTKESACLIPKRTMKKQ